MSDDAVVEKKGRGRKPASEDTPASPKKRGRAPADKSPAKDGAAPAKRGRGRPKGSKAPKAAAKPKVFFSQILVEETCCMVIVQKFTSVLYWKDTFYRL